MSSVTVYTSGGIHLKPPSLLYLSQNGMTPLMHAAYKGKADMCRLLLQHGADVNCNEHEHGYTALMFAGLSGTGLVKMYNQCTFILFVLGFFW